MMVKRLFIVLLASVALLAVACGPTAPATTAPTAVPAANTPTTAPPPPQPSPTTVAAVQPTAAPVAPTTAPTIAPTAAPVAIRIAGPFAGEAQALNGAGATFPAVLYSKWFEEYAKLTNVKINYQGIGSGGGIKGLQDATVDFGATDGPMTEEQLKAAKGDVLHIPTTLGAVVVTYNVPEARTPLKLTGDVIAGIFLGEIKKWNDAKLTADNPDLQNVNQDIVVVHRSDSSGTTFAFTDYLSAVSPAWKTGVGSATAVKWPTGLGGQGNAGVAGEVKQNAYAIGYVELIYAIQSKLGYADVKNKSGKFVTASLDSVTAAAAARAADVPADLRVSIVDATGDAVYPISTFTWIIAYTKQTDKAKAIALTRLLWWATHDGQRFSGDLGYAPLPAAIVAKDEAKIMSITVDGAPAFPGK